MELILFSQLQGNRRGITCQMGSKCYLPPDTSEHILV